MNLQCGVAGLVQESLGQGSREGVLQKESRGWDASLSGVFGEQVGWPKGRESACQLYHDSCVGDGPFIETGKPDRPPPTPFSEKITGYIWDMGFGRTSKETFPFSSQRQESDV